MYPKINDSLRPFNIFKILMQSKICMKFTYDIDLRESDLIY